MCLLAILYLLYVNLSPSPLLISDLGCLSFFCLSFCCLHSTSPLYFLAINPLSDTWFISIFSHSVGCLFLHWLVSFDAPKFSILMKFCLFFFFLVITKKSLPNAMYRGFSPVFASNSFIVLALMFWPLIHFWVNFCIWC